MWNTDREVKIHVDPFRFAISLCCLFWFFVTCVFAGVFGWSYSEWVSGSPFSYEDACRLTYTDDAIISEKEMKRWAGMEGWPLKHPHYDVSKKACVCSSDSDPSSSSGDTPAWIAPGDLVSLYENGVPGKSLPSEFVTKYAESYSRQDHVKVCIDQSRLLTLWNSGHCHSSYEKTISSIFTGWDGALYCSTPCPYPWKKCKVGQTLNIGNNDLYKKFEFTPNNNTYGCCNNPRLLGADGSVITPGPHCEGPNNCWYYGSLCTKDNCIIECTDKTATCSHSS